MTVKYCEICDGELLVEHRRMGHGLYSNRFHRSVSSDGVLFCYGGLYCWFCNDCWRLINTKDVHLLLEEVNK